MFRKALTFLVLVAFSAQPVAANCIQTPSQGYSFATISLTKVNAESIAGRDVSSGETLVFLYGHDLQIPGRAAITGLKIGDILYLKTECVRDNVRVVSINANIWTGIVRIVHHEDSNLQIQALNDQTLKPVTALYPSYLGEVPERATFLPNVEITTRSGTVKPDALFDGLIMKVFGYKPPSSNTISIFRAEVLNKANLHS